MAKPKRAVKTASRPARPVPPHIVAGIEALFVDLAKEERRRHRIKYSQKRPKDGEEREELKPPNTTLPIRAKIGKLVAEFVGDHRSRSEVYGCNLYGKLEKALDGLFSARTLRVLKRYADLQAAVIRGHVATGVSWNEAMKDTFERPSGSKKLRGK